MTSKVNRVHPLDMYAMFNKDAHNGPVSIVFTRLLLYKSIMTLTLTSKINRVHHVPWLTCQPSLTKMHTKVQSPLCSQGYFHVCPLWPWLMTINRVHPFIIVICLPSLIELHTTVSIVFTRFSPYKSMVTLNFDLWPKKINGVHHLTMVNMFAKFDDEAYNSSISIAFTRLFPYMSILTLTFDFQNQ